MHFINRSEFYQDSLQVPGVFNWLCTDTRQLYQANLIKYPEKMLKFRDRTLNYTLNSGAFRAPEFSDIDWAESVVLFGCSVVFGDGLDDSECLSSQLSELLARPVINMGVSGSSARLMAMNNLVLYHSWPTPWRVINIWPTADRITEITDQGANCYGVWTQNMGHSRDRTVFQRLKGQLTDYDVLAQARRWAEIWATLNHGAYHMDTELFFNSLTVRSLWADRALDLTWAHGTDQVIGCGLLDWDFENTARDCLHPSADTVRQWAEQIAPMLNDSPSL